MRNPHRRYFIPLLMAWIGITLGSAFPPTATARLHDPMKPERLPALLSPADQVDAVSPLTQLNAIIGTASSRVAIFGTTQVHEGERIGNYRVKKIHPAYVELSDGETLTQRHLFPTITVSRGDK